MLFRSVRLGDPETQAVLPLMNFDFAEMCKSITNGTLDKFDFRWKKGFVCAPVAVSGGYPGKFEKGYEIKIDRTTLDKTGDMLYIAGANISEDDKLVTSGGRVLAVSAYAPTFDEAWAKAYEGLKCVTFKNMFFRTDIGLPGAAESGEL